MRVPCVSNDGQRVVQSHFLESTGRGQPAFVELAGNEPRPAGFLLKAVQEESSSYNTLQGRTLNDDGRVLREEPSFDHSDSPVGRAQGQNLFAKNSIVTLQEEWSS